MKKKLEEQKLQLEEQYKAMNSSQKQALLHQRMPGAESEMSAFSKNDDGPPTKLPDISRGNGLSELKNGHASGIADI